MNIEEYDFQHGKIISIVILEKTIEVVFEQWNCNFLKLLFKNYIAIKDLHSVNCETSYLLYHHSSDFKNEVISNIYLCENDLDFSENIKSFSFLNSWEDIIILEILATNVEVHRHIVNV